MAVLVDALPLIEGTDDALVALLHSLRPPDWDKTAVGSWSVKDVAAHLLDGNVRRLSLARDGLKPPHPDQAIEGHQDLVSFLDQLNHEWTRAARRLSGRLITDLLSFTNPQVRDFFASLDPEGEAPFPVSWAGQHADEAWLDIAREFTEKWHHQQQIRDAVGAPGLREERFVRPLLETLVLALPRAYEGVAAVPGTTVTLSTADLPGAVWTVMRGRDRWHVESRTPDVAVNAAIELPSDTTWRLLMKGVDASEARRRATIRGDEKLAEPLFRARGVMA